MKKNSFDKTEFGPRELSSSAALRLYRYMGAAPVVTKLQLSPIAFREENPLSLSELFARFSYPEVYLNRDDFARLSRKLNLRLPILDTALLEALQSAQTDVGASVEDLDEIIYKMGETSQRDFAEIKSFLARFKEFTYAYLAAIPGGRRDAETETLQKALSNERNKKYIAEVGKLVGHDRLERSAKKVSGAIEALLALKREITSAREAIKAAQENKLAEIKKAGTDDFYTHVFNELLARPNPTEARIVYKIKEDLVAGATEEEAAFRARGAANSDPNLLIGDEEPESSVPYGRALFLASEELRGLSEKFKDNNARLADIADRYKGENRNARKKKEITKYLNEKTETDSRVYANRTLVAPGKYIPQGETGVDERAFKEALESAISSLASSIVFKERGEKLREVQATLDYVANLADLVLACRVEFGDAEIFDIGKRAFNLFKATKQSSSYSESELNDFLGKAGELAENLRRRTRLIQFYAEHSERITPDMLITTLNEDFFTRGGIQGVKREELFAKAKTRLAVSDIEERKEATALQLSEPDYLDDYVVGKAYAQAARQLFSKEKEGETEFNEKLAAAIPELYYSYLNTEIQSVFPGSEKERAAFSARLRAIKKGSAVSIDDPEGFYTGAKLSLIKELVARTGIAKLGSVQKTGFLRAMLEDAQRQDEKKIAIGDLSPEELDPGEALGGELIDDEEVSESVAEADIEKSREVVVVSPDSADADKPDYFKVSFSELRKIVGLPQFSDTPGEGGDQIDKVRQCAQQNATNTALISAKLHIALEGVRSATTASILQYLGEERSSEGSLEAFRKKLSALISKDKKPFYKPKKASGAGEAIIDESLLALNTATKDNDLKAIIKSIQSEEPTEKVKPRTVGWRILTTVLTTTFQSDVRNILRGKNSGYSAEDADNAVQEAIIDVFVRGGENSGPSIITYIKDPKHTDTESFIYWMVRRAQMRIRAILRDTDRGALSGELAYEPDKMLTLGKKKGQKPLPLYVKREFSLQLSEVIAADKSAARLAQSKGVSSINALVSKQLAEDFKNKYTKKEALTVARARIEDYEQQAGSDVTDDDYAIALLFMTGLAKAILGKMVDPERKAKYVYDTVTEKTYIMLGIEKRLAGRFPTSEDRATPAYDSAWNDAYNKVTSSKAERLEIRRLGEEAIRSTPLYIATAFGESGSAEPLEFMPVPAEFVSSPGTLLAYLPNYSIAVRAVPLYRTESLLALPEIRPPEHLGEKDRFVEFVEKFTDKDTGVKPQSAGLTAISYELAFGDDIDAISGDRSGDSTSDRDIAESEGELIAGSSVFGAARILADETAAVSTSDFNTYLTNQALEIIEQRTDPNWALGVKLFRKRQELAQGGKEILKDAEAKKSLESYAAPKKKGDKQKKTTYYVVGPELISRVIAGDPNYAIPEGRSKGKTPDVKYVRERLALTEKAILGIWDHLIAIDYGDAESRSKKDDLDISIFKEITKFVPGAGKSVTPYLFERPTLEMNKYRSAVLKGREYFLTETRAETRPPIDAPEVPTFDVVCFNLAGDTYVRPNKTADELYISKKSAQSKLESREFRYCMAELDLSDDMFASLFPRQGQVNKKRVTLYDNKKSRIIDNFIFLEENKAKLEEIAQKLEQQERDRLSISFLLNHIRNGEIAAYRQNARSISPAQVEAYFKTPSQQKRLLESAKELKLAIDAGDDLPDDIRELVDKMDKVVEKGVRLARVRGAFDMNEILKARTTVEPFYYLQSGRVKTILEEVFERLASSVERQREHILEDQQEIEKNAELVPDEEETPTESVADILDAWGESPKVTAKKQKAAAPRKMKPRPAYWEHY